MARYYLAVLLINILFSVLFYIKMKHSGLSLRSFVLISGISLLSGVVFPMLTGLTNLYTALGINIILVSLSAYFIAEKEGVLDQEAEEQSFEAVSYLTQRYENQATVLTDSETIDVDSTDQEAVNPEPGDEEPVDDEVIDEQVTDEASMDKEIIIEECMNEEVEKKESTNEEVINEESANEVVVDEESVDEEIIDEESVNQQILVEDSANQQVVDEESVVEEVVEDKTMDNEDTDSTDEKIREYLTDTEDEINMVAAAAEPDQEVNFEFDQQGDWVMDAPQVNTYNDGEIRESYINRGFESKFEGKLDQAVKFFIAALELSPPPDLELMLSLDLFSMFRELGYYDRAKDCLNKFAERNYSGLSAVEAEEIKISLKHLEILNDLLTKANTPGLPYSRVPALIKLSAEEKLNSWKSETFE